MPVFNWKVPPIWKGSECWVIGGGTSAPRQFGVPEDIVKKVMKREIDPEAYSPYFKPIHDKHIIGINNAYQIGDWIDVVFFGDCSWYLVHRKKLANFPGLKITSCPQYSTRSKEESEGVKYLARDKANSKGISPHPTAVSWNGNSGCAAISLAVHLGVKRIILLGFDMFIDADKFSHWHGSHGAKRSPPFHRHKKGFAKIDEDVKRLGIQIINASPDSTIVEFPKMSVDEILKGELK